MATKPPTANFYTPEGTRLVQSACLTLATYLGTFLDELVVVGGLAPSLLMPIDRLKEGQEAHVGTLGLDLGLRLAILEESRYIELVDQLRSAGFEPTSPKDGKLKD